MSQGADVASTRAATTRIDRSARNVRTSAAVAAATAAVNTVPRLARITLGLNRSVRRIGDEERVGTRAVGRPQDRAQVAGLLDGFEHDHEGIGGQAKRSEVAGGCRTIARMPSDRAPKATLPNAVARRSRSGRRASSRRRTADSASADRTSSGATNASSTSMPASSARRPRGPRRRSLALAGPALADRAGWPRPEVVDWPGW